MKATAQIMSIILLVTFSFSNYSFAESTKKSSQKPSTKQRSHSQKYTSESIDLACQKLPQKYLGHDLRTIYDAMVKREKAMVKGEFETTEKYEGRISTIEKSPILGKLGINDVFVLSVPTAFDYNADKQLLIAIIDSDMLVERFRIESRLTIKGPEISNRESSYIGSNAFGAKIKVEQQSTVESTLVVSNPEVFKKIPDFPDISFKIENFPIEKAKTVKNKLRGLIVFKLKEPYSSDGFHSIRPTYDSPSEYLSTYHNVYAEVIASWIYNIDTGEIFLKEGYW